MNEAPLIDERFRVLGRLGSGAMGIVFRAHDVTLDRPVALKIIDPQLASDPTIMDRFKREAQALAALRHQNVVSIYGFGPYGRSHYFAMEYVEGNNLDTMIEERLSRGATVRLEWAIEIGTQIASGLAAAHAKGIIHRDVKPSNIVIESSSGRPVLIDFGIARRWTSSSPRLSAVTGTPSYMAPEQAKDDRIPITKAADIYSFACTMFELLTGRSVFVADDVTDMLLAHMREPAPKLSSIRPEYAAFDAAFERALAKNPADRHDEITDFAADIELASRRGGLVFSKIPASATVQRAKTMRVAVLANEESLRRSLVREAGRVLFENGRVMLVECLGSRSELLRACQREPAELVLIDDGAAAGEGFTTAANVRQVLPNAEIIVLTGTFTKPDDALRIQRVLKPFNARALAEKLNQCITTVDTCANRHTLAITTRA